MTDLGSSAQEPLGWVRFDADPWEQATFAVTPGAFGVRRPNGTTTWLALGDIRRIDETAAESNGWAQIELVLTDARTVGAKISTARLGELLAVMTAAPRTEPAAREAPAAAATPTASPPGASPVATASTQRATSRVLIGVAAAFVALVLAATTLAGAWWLFARPGDHELRGVYILFDEDGEIDGSIGDCSGTGGYSDFSSGSDVKVRDADGKIVGSTSLEDPGDLDELYERIAEADASFADVAEVADVIGDAEGYVCPLVFTVTVPDSDLYELDIGTGRRGTQTYTRDQLDEQGWLVSISLGT